MHLGQPQALTELVLRVCSLERAVELRRQFLCDKPDFQPYAAFIRLTRQSEGSISPSMIARFLKDNHSEISIGACQSFVTHYDLDRDGALSYKEFIEVLLPKEHPTLRAFVSQRECFEISPDEYLSYETEVCLAALLYQEVTLFTDLKTTYGYLADRQSAIITAERVLSVVDLTKSGNINFGNLQAFFNSCGLLPYDAELINFLRRLDQDDDGVVNRKELIAFFVLCEQGREPNQERPSSSRQSNREGTGASQEQPRRPSPYLRSERPVDSSQDRDVSKRTGLSYNTNSKVDRPRARESPKEPIESPEFVEPKREITTSSSQQGLATVSRQVPEKRVIDLDHYRKTLESQIGRRTPLNPRGRTQEEVEPVTRRRENEATPNREARNQTPGRTQIAFDRSARLDRSRTPVRNEGGQYQTNKVEPEHPSSAVQQRPYSTIAYNSTRRGEPATKPEERGTDLHRSTRGSGSSHLRIEDSSKPEYIRERKVEREYTPVSREHSQTLGTPQTQHRITSDISNKNKYINASQKSQPDERLSRTEVIDRSADHGIQESKARTQPLGAEVIPAGSRAYRDPVNREAEEFTSGEYNTRRTPASEHRSQAAPNSVENRSSESIYKAFKMILNQERNLELARRELVTKTDFDVNEIFNRIDKKGRKWFTIEDFRMFLGELGLKNIDTRALIDLYSSYDANQSCLLSFEQLVDMLCPLDNNYAEYLNKRDRKVDPNSSKVAGESTLELLADVFNRQFSLRKSLVDAKRLIKHENLDLNIVFDLLDLEAKGQITVKDVS